jgi:hypothetical protein
MTNLPSEALGVHPGQASRESGGGAGSAPPARERPAARCP